MHLRAGALEKSDGGMTMRQYYAGLAMQGIVAGHLAQSDEKVIGEGDPSLIAQTAIALADALIAALEPLAPRERDPMVAELTVGLEALHELAVRHHLGGTDECQKALELINRADGNT